MIRLPSSGGTGRAATTPSGRVRSALLGALLAAACGSPRAIPEWQLRAERLAPEGDPVAVLEVYRQAAAAGASPAAELAGARFLLTYQKLGWALQMLRQLAESHPGESKVWLLRYQTALASRWYDEARESAHRLRELAGDDATVLRHLGVLEIRNRRAEVAAELLRRSLAIDRESAAGWYALGRAEEIAHRIPQALEAYTRATELADSAARWRRARLLARRGGEEEARRILERLLSEGAINTSGFYLLGNLRQQQGDRESAEELLSRHRLRARAEKQAKEQHMRRQSLVEEVLIQVRDGHHDEARRLLVELRAAYGADERLDVLEAEIWAAEGRLSRALELTHRALRRRPRGWRYHFLLAEYFDRLGLQADASGEVGAALRLQPLALEIRRLDLRLAELAGEKGEIDRKRAVLETLKAFALPEQRDLAIPLAGEARIRLLFDLIQMHPLAAKPQEEGIPLD